MGQLSKPQGWGCAQRGQGQEPPPCAWSPRARRTCLKGQRLQPSPLRIYLLLTVLSFLLFVLQFHVFHQSLSVLIFDKINEINEPLGHTLSSICNFMIEFSHQTCEDSPLGPRAWPGDSFVSKQTEPHVSSKCGVELLCEIGCGQSARHLWVELSFWKVPKSPCLESTG